VSEAVRAALAAVVEGRSLSVDEARLAMGAVMDGEATPAQLAALLVALRMRGETVEELAGFASAMRERVLKVEAPDGAIDVVGTGGDGSGTFNISTAAAFVVASTGVPVAKHGNRAITSWSGSADVLEALGVRIDHTADSAAASLREHGFAFLFAPGFHPAMKHAGPTRRELGIRTVFNLLGPLTNPAGATRQIVGVPRSELTEPIARALMLLGSARAWVVHGADGIDEISTTGHTKVSECRDGAVHTFYIHPSDFGLPKASAGDLRGGDAAQNAGIIRQLLGGQSGPHRDVVAFNAGAALFVAGKAPSVDEGIRAARSAIDSGAATATLAAMVRLSNAEVVA